MTRHAWICLPSRFPMCRQRALAALILAAAACGCAAGRQPPVADASLYQRLGGMSAITAVVHDAVGNIAADSRIRGRFAGGGHPNLTRDLADLFCVRAGGPCTYRGRDMSTAHDGMNLRDDEFDALVEDLTMSLDKFNVPGREKSELLAIVGQMRNAIVGH